MVGLGITWIAITWIQPPSNATISGYFVTIEGPKVGQEQDASFRGAVSSANVTGIIYRM